MIFLTIFSSNVIQAADNTYPDHIILGIGEIYSQKTQSIKTYTLSNKTVSSIKVNDTSLLIKALAKGYSQLIIWDKNGHESRLSIFVVAKKEKLLLAQISESITEKSIKTKLTGKLLSLTGSIETYQTYEDIRQLKQLISSQISLNSLVLDKSVKKKILQDILYILIKDFHDEVECHFNSINLNCIYDSTYPISKDLQKYLSEKYIVTFIPNNNRSLNRLFKLKFKVIQFETQAGKEMSLGLDQISGNLNSILDGNIQNLIEDNKILLNQKDVEISTLAEPELLIRINTESLISVGAEIPFKTAGEDKLEMTGWKFAGLKIRTKLSSIGNKLVLDLENEFTRPAEGDSISGNKEKNSFLIQTNKAIKVFEIGFSAKSNQNSKLPYLSSIPILGKIFKSTQDANSYKKISALVHLEEIYE